MDASKYIKWNNQLSKHIENNKLILLFLPDNVQNIIEHMFIENIYVTSLGNDFYMRCTLRSPFESVSVEHFYYFIDSVYKYAFDIKCSNKSILERKDRELLDDVFSTFDWLSMNKDING